MDRISLSYKSYDWLFRNVGAGIFELTITRYINGLIIPKGFKTDFRSGPRFLDTLIPKYSVAFVVHDYLYQTGERSRKEADKIQDDILKNDPCFTFVERKMIYAGVRMFGRGHWNYYRNGGEFPKKKLA